MVVVFSNVVDVWYATIMAYVPTILAALVVLLIGWIVGRLLGKAVRILLDKISEQHLVEKVADETSFAGSVKNAGMTVGYIGDIAVRIFVYLIAVLAAVDILNMDYMSKLMTTIVEYIPHVVAFVIILIVGFLLSDYFIDFLARYYAKQEIQLIRGCCMNIFNCTIVPFGIRNIPAFLPECILFNTNCTTGLLFSSYATASSARSFSCSGSSCIS